jgi:hypothetical protein
MAVIAPGSEGATSGSMGGKAAVGEDEDARSHERRLDSFIKESADGRSPISGVLGAGMTATGKA